MLDFHGASPLRSATCSWRDHATWIGSHASPCVMQRHRACARCRWVSAVSASADQKASRSVVDGGPRALMPFLRSGSRSGDSWPHAMIGRRTAARHVPAERRSYMRLSYIAVGGWALLFVIFTGFTPAFADVSYIYDQLGRLVAVIDPATDTAVYSYDGVGNLLSISRYPSSTVSVIDFTPSSGPVGTPVNISGTGFSPIAGQNPVTFNGTTATVVSSTATQIVTSVPAGASTGPIAVTTTMKPARRSSTARPSHWPSIPVARCWSKRPSRGSTISLSSTQRRWGRLRRLEARRGSSPLRSSEPLG